MKKLVLTTVCALAMTGAAFAQGTLSWATPASAITAQTNATQYSPLFGGAAGPAGSTVGNAGLTPGGGYYYELLYTAYSGSQATIPTLGSLLAWSDTGLTATNGNTAGRLTPTIPNDTAAIVPWAAGVTDSIVLVGWSANLGTSWGAVSNELKNGYATVLAGQQGFFGVSATGYLTTFDTATSPGATVFNSSATSEGLPIFSTLTQLYLLPVVPEPTTIALAGLGGLALMLFRRQRK
jgi:hypothetical protein